MNVPWQPSNAFEEQIINIQPLNNFIYGGSITLTSDIPQNYPRPPAHLEYAAKQKALRQQQQAEYEKTGKINYKLHLINDIRRMAGIASVGEKSTLNDWQNRQNVEQETVGMMRYFGLGPSVEEPLNDKITLSTYPVEKTIKLKRNGRRLRALYFDENVFRMKPKTKDEESGDFLVSSFSTSRSLDNNARPTTTETITSSSTSISSSITSSSYYTNMNSVGSVNTFDTYKDIDAYESYPTNYDKLLVDKGETGEFYNSASSCSTLLQNNNAKDIVENVVEALEEWPGLNASLIKKKNKKHKKISRNPIQNNPAKVELETVNIVTITPTTSLSYADMTKKSSTHDNEMKMKMKKKEKNVKKVSQFVSLTELYKKKRQQKQ